MNNFKRCPIQPLPGNGSLCESCQHRIVIEPCQARLKEEQKVNTIPVCIPLYKPPRRRINGEWQDAYPLLERTTPAGKPLQNNLLQENYLDTEFQEICNLYLSEFPDETRLPDCPICGTNQLKEYRHESYIRCENCHTGFNVSETFDIESASRILPANTVEEHKKQLLINLTRGKPCIP